MKSTLVATLVACALMSPAAAAADGGSITNVYAVGDGTVAATYTSTFSGCSSTGSCVWYPWAAQVPAWVGCSVDQAHLTYVGTVFENPGTQVGAGVFYPVYNPARVCLFARDADGVQHLLADAVYPAGSTQAAGGGSPAPAPTTTPAPTTSDDGDSEWAPPLSIADARALLPATLKGKYGRRWTKHRHFMRSCARLTGEKVRCHVRWDSGSYRYRGTVTLRNDPDAPASSYVSTTSIKRTRIRYGSSTRNSTNAQGNAGGTDSPAPPRRCDPNYSGCLNPDASDYDCVGGSGDGPLYTGQVRVLGDDHYDLDRDGDGIGCDS